MRRYLPLSLLLGSLACTVLFGPVAAQDDPNYKPYAPKVAAANDDWKKAIQRIRVPASTRVDLWAAEPLLTQPVAFCIDEKNRIFVSETFRLHKGVTDVRNFPAWLEGDVASRTVADRIALMQKHLGKKAESWAVDHERIRLLEDTKGTGQADRSVVFADGFNRLEDGLGAGLLARNGTVWYACIPNLWRLRDTKGTGKADERQALHTGYGVHIAFIGHDLHGPRLGPDGKLYFSCGDRGLHVETAGKVISNPDSGAVLRCNPDGSELELVATGLRNPQGIVFDQFGNLFTGDNNADGGDRARWVQIVEGGDSGWRLSYQSMNFPTGLGPWNAERLWDAKNPTPAPYVVPPITNLGDGPSGVCYDPGVTALPERYRQHFFLCDFRGGSGNSGIRSFALKPKGASFELTDAHECVWSVLPTDVHFGTDGALYLADWVEGWGLNGRGRIYKVHDPELSKSAKVLEVKKLLADGFAQRPVGELVQLLAHDDMRIRQEAQFALADQGQAAVEPLAGVARKHAKQLARIHAIWGLGQVGRKEPAALKPLHELVKDSDAEVRAQAAKVLGDARAADAYEALLPLLRDPEARVRFFAAQSLGKLGKKEATAGLLQLLRENNDQDVYLRHAAAVALARLDDRAALLSAAKDEAAAVRLGALLALRRLESPEIAVFLHDAEPRLVLEAARAINDVPIPAALPKLAALSERPKLPDAVGYRALNAHFRLGQSANAKALAAFAGRADVPETQRVEALRYLGDWAKPASRDRVVGLWRPLEARDPQPAAEAVRTALGGVLSGPDKVRQEGAKLAAKYGIQDIGPTLLSMLSDPKGNAATRVEMLQALHALNDQRLPEAVKLALADGDARVRTAGRRVQARVQPMEALPGLLTAVERGETVERQGALLALADLKEPRVDAFLITWLDKLLAKDVPAEVQLDLLEAAARRSSPEVKKKLGQVEAARDAKDPLAPYRETLAGGDAEAGRRLFLHKAEVSCLRCHKVQGEGGEVGPELTGIAAKQPREYLLESIVAPNRQIAKGFETTVLGLKNGQIVTGIVKTETGQEIQLMTAEGKLVQVAKDQIDERQTGKSPMPEDILKSLTKRELRDLVEFLAGLK